MARLTTLFRYRSLSGDGFRFTQDIFFRNRLYWPLHSQLNDPAEGVYRVEHRLIQRPNGLWYPRPSPLTRAQGEVRVLSFSEDPKHPLMWAHYADAHRGICIGFRRDRLPGAGRVRYPQRVPRLKPSLTDGERLAAAFMTKRAAWAYEREWRLISSADTSVGGSADYLPLPRGVVTQVILGDRISSDDRDWVLEWLKITGSRARVRRVEFSGAAGQLRLLDLAE